jgi:hypothetical protein
MHVVTMTTSPGREIAARQAFETLVVQCERFHLLLDGFEDVPAWVNRARAAHREKLEVWLFSPDGVVGDAGKFFWSDRIPKHATHVIVDDDCVFPGDLVSRLANVVQDKRCVAGACGFEVHILGTEKDAYVSDSVRLTEANERLQVVHILGTEAIAYRVADFELHFERFRWRPNVGRYLLARTATEQKLPLFVIPRPANWIHKIQVIPQPLLAEGFGDPNEDAQRILNATNWRTW